jgi:tetratricopeptide (TPR) repeat protein
MGPGFGDIPRWAAGIVPQYPQENWGWAVLLYPRLLVSVSLLAACVCAMSMTSWAQASHSESVQIKPPLIRGIDPPAPDATAADLEARADQLRSSKLYLDAIDYYRAALAKQKGSAVLFNKIGISELMMQRYKEAKKSFDQAIKADRKFADAYNNLGVVYYEERRYGPAVKQYNRAIAIDDTSASFFSNLGAALFAKKEFDPAVMAYERAVALDPDVFERTSRGGVQAQLPSPGDRARYDYTVAKLYAKMGFSDRSLEYLRKALEEGYKDFKNVYKDEEFAALRKDKRFTELVAAKVPALPE